MISDEIKMRTNLLTRALLVATTVIVVAYGLVSSAVWMRMALGLFAINFAMLSYSWFYRSKEKGRGKYYDERIHRDVDRAARNGYVFLMVSLVVLVIMDGVSSYLIDLTTAVVQVQLIGFVIYYLSRIKYSHSPL